MYIYWGLNTQVSKIISFLRIQMHSTFPLKIVTTNQNTAAFKTTALEIKMEYILSFKTNSNSNRVKGSKLKYSIDTL